jgi:hypothetical protein
LAGGLSPALFPSDTSGLPAAQTRAVLNLQPEGGR